MEQPTGTGGEIRDRMAGGKASIPLAGTAVYMTPYSRLEKGRSWEEHIPARKWLYQTPIDLLIKASNGASDYGNKFGQPLICGSVLTFEHFENGKNVWIRQSDHARGWRRLWQAKPKYQRTT